MKKELFCLLLILFPVLVYAENTVVEGIKYSLDEATLTAEATGLVDSTLTRLVIPASVKSNGMEYKVQSVGDNAFHTNDFTSISLPEGLISIGISSFMYSRKLKCITVPHSVQTIGAGAFSHCTRMKVAVLGKELKYIGEGAYHETALHEMYVYANQIPETIFDTSPFPDFTEWQQLQLFVPGELVEGYRLSDKAYWSQIQDKNIMPFPGDETVEHSGLTFYLDKSQKSAVLARSQIDSCTVEVPAYVEVDGEQYAVNSIAKWAFALTDTAVLKSVVLPEGLIRIEERAFEDCGITDITLPNSVEYVGEQAFAACLSLNSIRFGENIHTIADFATTRCSNLSSIYILAKEIPKDVAPYALSPDPYTIGGMDNIFLYVPENLVEVYRSSTLQPWVDFKDENVYAIGGSSTIQSLKCSTKKPAHFSLNGYPLKSPTKGINIISHSDGTTRKVVIK